MDLLIVKPSSLGDIIHGLVAAQAIRDQLPGARISWVVRDRFEEVVRACPTVNGTIFPFARHDGLAGLWKICRTLRRHSFEAVLDWQGLARSALMARAARSPRRLGRSDAREGATLAYSEKIPLPPGGRQSHAIAILLETLPLLGLARQPGSPITLRAPAASTTEPRLADRKPVLLVPNSRGTHKEWPYFRELTAALLANPACPPVVWDSHLPWQSPPDAPPDHFFNLTTRTSLLEMIGLVAGAALVVVNDAGPLHIAAALGTPVLALFGPTPPGRFGPFPPERPGHHLLQAPDGDLAMLPASRVASAVFRILGIG